MVFLPESAETRIVQIPGIEAGDVSGTERILLVEDEPALREFAARVIRDKGYVVYEAADPRGAFAIWEEQSGRFDLLLTDIVMPISSGFELSDKLTRQKASLKVVYMSGFSEAATVGLRPDLLREDNFLKKPFTATKLLLSIRAALGPKTPDAE
jgi:CheY-like chemotaxis protein